MKKICEVCKNEFVTKYKAKKFCYGSCTDYADKMRKKNHYENNKDKYIERNVNRRSLALKKQKKEKKFPTIQEYQKNYRNTDKFKEKSKEYSKKYRERNKDIEKNGHLKRKFGITLDQYKKMQKDQKNLCAICELPEVPGKDLSVDHCHSTGSIRGLLCFNCNSSLGKFNDSIEVLLRAIKYLQKFIS